MNQSSFKMTKHIEKRLGLTGSSRMGRLTAWTCALLCAGKLVCPAQLHGASTLGPNHVDFCYSPPEWQAAICLPDDPCKSLVDDQGKLLYHYNQGRREFGTTLAVEVTSNAVWQKQELESPRVPIVRTSLAADGLQIMEESFAVTDLPRDVIHQPVLQRTDGGLFLWKWANPPPEVHASISNIATHNNGSLQFEVSGKSRRIALVLCESWWNQPGHRVEVLRVEGAESRVVDLVADVGKDKVGIFWFDGKDTNGDGHIDIQVEAAGQSSDKNTILNGLWVFPANEPENDQALLAGKLDGHALGRLDQTSLVGPSRNDLILVSVTNAGTETRTFIPKLVVDTALGCQLQEQHAVVGNHETISCSLKMTGLLDGKQLQLEPVTVSAGQSVRFFVLYSGGGTIVFRPTTVKDALAARDHAAAYWEKAPLPYGRVQVPDPQIQGLIDSSIRNIWQAREIKKGVPVFQVGPTCYRGLWIVDGAFLLESATILGAGQEARNGVAYTLGLQKPTGAFEVLCPQYYKENGIVLWTCVRHAMLTQDKAWLASVWPQLEKAADYIKELRQRSLTNATLLDDGINPPGEIDGGLWGGAAHFSRPEFSNVHCNLAGLHAFIQGAHWLGKTETAALWQSEYDDLYATFRKAAARDICQDSKGNSYVPIFMGNAGKELPQRAQWTFCHAVYPGQIFAKDDALVASTLSMLEATEREGMVYGTGWEATGIWNYFASFYGHAWLWQGDGRKAAQILYAYANHASPTLAWREEQSLHGAKFRKVGDMPHNWASAEFIRLAVHLLEIDRGNELHLFEGLPLEWARPGMVTGLKGIATPFGKLNMELKIAADGKTAHLWVDPIPDATCQKIVVHLAGWARNQKNASIELDPKKRNDYAIPLALDSITPQAK
jgi:hypothetical protein